jgi:hypothetical protein
MSFRGLVSEKSRQPINNPKAKLHSNPVISMVIPYLTKFRVTIVAFYNSFLLLRAMCDTITFVVVIETW